MQRGTIRTAVRDGDLYENILGRVFRVFDEHVEIAAFVEYARIEQLVFEVVTAPTGVRLRQIIIGKRRLRVLVEIFHIRMGRRRIEIEVVFLDVLPVIPLAIGETEQSFLENRVLPIPERYRKAEALAVVANPGEPILAPAIGSRARLIVR